MKPSPVRRLTLPESLQQQLSAFRRRVWAVKLIEAVCGAAFGVLAAYLAIFLLDRVWNTPETARAGILGVAVFACALVPLALHRWVWRRRRPDQLARLLSRAYPSIGDQLLGVIELADSESEQARSLTLCEAAIQQVAEASRPRDFTAAVPNPKHRRRSVLAVSALTVVLGLLAVYPAAAVNAWARFLTPWRDIPRYTFAMVEPLPDRLVVAHGEPFSTTVTLAQQSVARPHQAEARIGTQSPVVATLTNGRYAFELPPQLEPVALELRVGDFTQQIGVEPTLRPELSSVAADVVLPDYLGRTRPERKDLRGGSLSVVNGSRVTLTATATRELTGAKVDEMPVTPQGSTLMSAPIRAEGNRQVTIQWQDRFGLAGREPFVLTINGREDEAPSIVCEGLPVRRVVLDTEQLTFTVRAHDDYGVRQVGMEWRGIDTTNFKNPAAGERILAAGGPDQEVVELTGTFTAKSLGIEPQPIHVRLFAEDYFPGRERVYSPPHLLYVLNAEQHAIWLTEQLSKWHRQSLDVRDREKQLFEINKQLRELSADELNQPDTRRRLDVQADAERANGRRLSNLVTTGEDLVQQAMRNPEFGVGHLEKWAEMLQILKDIAGNRMPSVADLLKEAAQAPRVAGNGSNARTVAAGQVRATPNGKPSASSKDQPPRSPTPSILDVESSQQPPGGKDKDAPPNESNGGSRLGLPVTALMGGGKGGDSCPAGQKVEEAVTKQQDLLAEFEKIADELNRVLANLEGSTLVKRLKAASRLQYRIGGRLGDLVGDAFGVSPRTKPAPAPQGNDVFTLLKKLDEAGAKARMAPPEPKLNLLKELSGQEATSSQDLSNIMDDMQAYFERRRFVQFKTVLDEMLKQDVVGSLRQLSDDLPKETGLSIAQCEYWSDTFDRWAEDLVEATSGGT